MPAGQQQRPSGSLAQPSAAGPQAQLPGQKARSFCVLTDAAPIQGALNCSECRTRPASSRLSKLAKSLCRIDVLPLSLFMAVPNWGLPYAPEGKAKRGGGGACSRLRCSYLLCFTPPPFPQHVPVLPPHNLSNHSAHSLTQGLAAWDQAWLIQYGTPTHCRQAGINPLQPCCMCGLKEEPHIYPHALSHRRVLPTGARDMTSRKTSS